jgi:tRNA(Phe) wybutosine-synthesizing methylase Tyw3
MKKHLTEEIVIKKAHVDLGMIPLINWLNSFETVTTYFCCEGDESVDIIDKPYVLFTCFDSIELITILTTFQHHSITEIHWNDLKRCFEYCTRFDDKNNLHSMIDYIKKKH